MSGSFVPPTSTYRHNSSFRCRRRSQVHTSSRSCPPCFHKVLLRTRPRRHTHSRLRRHKTQRTWREDAASTRFQLLVRYMCRVCGLFTVAHVASDQHVALVTRAAVTAHGVVALVVTAAVSGAALVNICNVNTGRWSSGYLNRNTSCHFK